jgi:hypothetical protein
MAGGLTVSPGGASRTIEHRLSGGWIAGSIPAWPYLLTKVSNPYSHVSNLFLERCLPKWAAFLLLKSLRKLQDAFNNYYCIGTTSPIVIIVSDACRRKQDYHASFA